MSGNSPNQQPPQQQQPQQPGPGANLQARVEQLEMDVANLQNEVADLQGNVMNLQNDVANLQTQTQPSAFRAIAITNQNVLSANTTVKVLLPNEVFDLNNEYNPSTSTFTPNQAGVYSICAGVFFDNSDFFDQNISLRIHVNGSAQVINNFIVNPGITSPIISVCSILRLQAGQNVEFFIDNGRPGTILAANFGTYFAAARYSS